MIYRNVGNKIAISMRSLKLPINNTQIKIIIQELGFTEINPNISSVARGLVGTSRYRRGAKPEEAPDTVDCSSMVKWVYGQIGIWLPRYSIDQRQLGRKVRQAKEGDLIFTCGWRSYYWDNPGDGVGHVGIITDKGTVIHAANGKLGVTESPWATFCASPERFRGIRRYFTDTGDLLVLQMEKRKIETSQELRWLILQRL